MGGLGITSSLREREKERDEMITAEDLKRERMGAVENYFYQKYQNRDKSTHQDTPKKREREREEGGILGE